MRTFLARTTCFTLLTTLLFGCTKMEEYATDSVSDYFPLEVGKYLIYRTDSTVFTNLGTNVEIHSYQEKNVIDAQITDAAGQTSYRVYRYLRDTAGTEPWRSAGTYMITPLSNRIEVVEDNLRFIKLQAPIRPGFSWKGNRYLNDEPYYPLFSFSNDDDGALSLWEYTYKSINDVFPYRQQTLTDVVHVEQVDERFSLDTINALGNKALVPHNSDAVWIRGTASDTVQISADAPDFGNERLTVYNQTNQFATLNGIKIPPAKALYFEFTNGKWFYPSPLTVANNRVMFPRNSSLAYIIGTATDTIQVNVKNVDTTTKKLTIYNKSNMPAYCDFNESLRNKYIAPGKGRIYELYQGQWQLYANLDNQVTEDPFISELPFGSTSFSVEKYAKGIGLIYQELLLWDYQPNKGGYKNGFGIKRTLLEHN